MKRNAASGLFTSVSIVNMGLLVLAFLLWLFASDRIYALHGTWFPMPRETFNALFCFLLGSCKIIVFVFNIVPWLVLSYIT